jgi:V-type H+-transporting ATPase proteolipid subunit
MSSANPLYAPFFGVIGCAASMVFTSLGAAYGTAKSGTGIAAMSVMRPELIMKSMIPVIMAGIIGEFLIQTSMPHLHWANCTSLFDSHSYLRFGCVRFDW